MALQYTDTVPSVPGWYWRRSKEGVKVVQLPHLGMVWPRPWQELRREAIESGNLDARSMLEGLPEEHWLIELAGPIEEPSN